MLVIKRKEGESIILTTSYGDVKVTIKALKSGGQVSISIEAPDVVEILREELISSPGYQE
jgi:carbon storage regulator CsrA